MVVSIKDVILKFIGTGIDDYYQACVFIYDMDGKLLYQKKTYNGEVRLCLDVGTLYKVVAISYGEVIKRVFYVRDNKSKYIFLFQRSIFGERTITFLLTDANYNNLPIEKGEIFLCQK